MPLSNQTSFKKGYIQPQSMREKRSQTLRMQYRLGIRKPIIIAWSAERKEKYSAKMREKARTLIGKEYKHGKYIQIRTETGRKYKHRVIMEQILGRELNTNEIVHHIDGDPQNNDVKNLLLLSHAEHSRLHSGDTSVVTGRIKGAVNHTLKPGQWSHKYSCCVVCASSTIKHATRGVCKNCNEKQRRRMSKLQKSKSPSR